MLKLIGERLMVTLKTTVTLPLTLILCVSAAAVRVSAQGSGGPGAGPAVVMTIPADYQEPPDGWRPLCNPDQSVCLYRARKGAEAFIVVNGKAGKSYDEVRNVVISAEGHVAYEARRQNEWMVVTDGVEGPGFDDIERLKIAGSTPGYIAIKGRQRRLVHGDKPYEPDAAIMDFTLSPDGKSAAYAVTRQQTMVTNSALIVNGEYMWEDNLVTNVTFTRDGHMVYASRTGLMTKGRSKLMLDESMLSEHSEVLTAIAVSGDGKKFAPVGCTGAAEFRRCALLLGGKPVGEASVIEIPVFSPDGTTLAWAERPTANGKWRVVIGGKPGPDVDAVLDPVSFSPNGRRHGYAVRIPGAIAAIIDGVIGPKYDDATNVAFSADSAHVSYIAIKGNTQRVVLDKVEGPTFAWVSVPRFDAAGKSLAYVAQDGRRFVKQTVTVGAPAATAARPE